MDSRTHHSAPSSGPGSLPSLARPLLPVTQTSPNKALQVLVPGSLKLSSKAVAGSPAAEALSCTQQQPKRGGPAASAKNAGCRPDQQWPTCHAASAGHTQKHTSSNTPMTYTRVVQTACRWQLKWRPGMPAAKKNNPIQPTTPSNLFLPLRWRRHSNRHAGPQLSS